MPRPPLAVGTWGHISDPKEVAPGVFRAMAKVRDMDGVTRKVEARGPSKERARRALEARLRARTAPPAGEVTPDTRVRDVARLWLAEVEARGRAANTVKRYRITVDLHVCKARGGVGELRVRECTTSRMEAFLRGVARDHGAPSAKVARTVMSGILGLAARHDAITGNPLREVSPISVPRKEVRALSPADVRVLRRTLAAWQSEPPVSGRRRRPDDLLDVVDVMLATGCRISEALALRWQDVDVDARKVAITGAVVVAGRGGAVRQDHPKSAGSVQTYTVDTHTADMLRRRWERSMDLGLVSPMVFPSSTGTVRDPSNYRKQWRTAREAIGFEWVTPHTFRKTVATRVADAEGLAAASAYLGHSGEAVTRTHYRAKAPEAADMTAALAGFWEDADRGATEAP